MQAGAASTIGSRTIADLITRSAVEHGDRVAMRYKRDGSWHDVTYRQLSETVEELGLGLIDLGIQPRERGCIRANTRPEWSYVDLAATSAGAVVVPIYQTNSPEECLWVLSDSGACAVICEDEAQLAKIEAIRDRVPDLRTIVIIDPPATGPSPNGAADGHGSDVITLDQVRERGRTHTRAELEKRRAGVRPEDDFTFIYTSGTTGPPKGCVLSHGNYCAMVNMVSEAGQITDDEVVYLYLPLAHSYALLIQLTVIYLGGTLAYFGGDTKQVINELLEVKPTYLPSVPRVFEKIYTLARNAIDSQPSAERDRVQEAIEVGAKVRNMMAHDEPVPEDLRKRFEEADEQLFKTVRAIFGGRVRHATSGAAPISHEILEFFWACGVPVLEGYGMTETSTGATISTAANHRFGTVGRALPGVELKIAPDGEILIKGPNIFQGYHHQASNSFGTIIDGWLHTGDLGSLDEDGYLSITGRKKDLIITAGGKNLTPSNIENDLKQCRWISQAVMHGDQRPYPVVLITLDEEEIAVFAREHGLPEDLAALAKEPAVHELIKQEVDRVNAKYAQVEQVKKFVILDHDLTHAAGELTPTLKVKRNVVNERYADLFDALYAA